MRIVLFCHSLLSDWNHGNAHFLRGVVADLQAREHDVHVYEPADAWSAANLVSDHGAEALERVRSAYPTLSVTRYNPSSLDLDAALDGADLVLVHEWNSHELVCRIGLHRRHNRYTLLFHDTHHRSVSDAEAMAAYELADYDGVLAFGEVIRERYLALGWSARVFTWHEAADTRLFYPRGAQEQDADVVWIGNWGDDERTSELREFLIEPLRREGLTATIHGVRYPAEAVAELRDCRASYRGWLPNFEAPDVFARHRATVHVPRRPYVRSLPGIPTIRPFEALACGIPLVSAPWDDAEGLFNAGMDYLVATNGRMMATLLRDIVEDRDLAHALSTHGRQTVLARHTCAHRVDELLAIHQRLVVGTAAPLERMLPA
jgi:spore maturation protein CgeB